MQPGIINRRPSEIFVRPRIKRGGHTFVDRNECKEKDKGALRNFRSNFLGNPLGFYVIPMQDHDNIFNNDNYEYLLRCAENYAGVIGKQLEHAKNSEPNLGIQLLYWDFKRIIGDDFDLNIDDDRYNWVIYKTHGWCVFRLYWLPIKFIESLEGDIRKIAVSFINRFIRSNDFTSFFESYEIEACLEYMMSVNEEHPDDLNYKKDQEYIDSFITGKIKDLILEVENTCYYDNLTESIEHFVPKNAKEETLISCFKSGLQFIGSSSIMDFNYDMYDDPDDYSDYYTPVELSSTIRLVYDINDKVCECMADDYNTWAQETSIQTPVSYCVLTEDTDVPFMDCDYPERFNIWFKNFVEITNSI